MSTTSAEAATISERLLQEPAIVSRLKLCALQQDLSKGNILHAIIRRKGLLKNTYVASSLLNLYVKCGALAKAKHVFNELSEHDVGTWTALISGYAHHGLAQQALELFDVMQDVGFYPNVATYVCALKSCGSAGATEKGREIHAQIVEKGLLENNCVLCTALIDMYGKCGDVQSAQISFEELDVRDQVAWTAHIAGFTQHGFHKKAVECFSQMQLEGCPPNAVTFACMLNSYGSLGADKKGKEIHSVIVKEGFLEFDLVLGSALVEFYVKCRLLRKAQEVFDELPVRNVVSWTILIMGYHLHKRDEDALCCFDQMRSEGILPNATNFATALQGCGSIHKSQKGQALHAEMVRKGLLDNDAVLENALINMYGKCGALSKAQAIFEEIKSQNIASWNTIMSGYFQQGYSLKALCCFEQMQLAKVRPDQVTFLCALQACGGAAAMVKGREIHSEIVREGLVLANRQIGNALVDMYAKCGLLANAQKVFDELPVHDTVSWNVLITGYWLNGQEEEALRHLEKMENEGISPDPPTFARLLKICGSAGAVEKGIKIQIEVDKQGLVQKDSVLGTALMDMYGKCNELAKAREVFSSIPLKDVVSWTALMAQYCQHGYFEESMKCFTLMQCRGIVSDAMALACILKVCGRLGTAEEGKGILSRVAAEQMPKEDRILASALLDMYAKCGILEKVQEIFANLSCRDVVAWTILISMYARLEKPNVMFFFFNKMVEDDIMPNSITFTVVLHACSYLGLLTEGESYFEFMFTVYNIVPNVEHCACMVKLFAKSGQFDKATKLITTGPLLSYQPAWLSLLGACRKWENWKLGCLTFFNAMRLNKDALAFVRLSCLHVTAGTQGKRHAQFSFLRDDCKYKKHGLNQSVGPSQNNYFSSLERELSHILIA